MSETEMKIEDKEEKEVWLTTYRNTSSMLMHTAITGDSNNNTLEFFSVKNIDDVDELSSLMADKALESFKERDNSGNF